MENKISSELIEKVLNPSSDGIFILGGTSILSDTKSRLDSIDEAVGEIEDSNIEIKLDVDPEESDEGYDESEDVCCESNPVEPPIDKNYNWKTDDFIGFEAPQDLFSGHIRRNTIYIYNKAIDKFRPIGHSTSEYDLPVELVGSWEKIYDGSDGYPFFIRRIKGDDIQVKYTANGIKTIFGHDIFETDDLRMLIKNIDDVTNINTKYNIYIKTVDIGCQTGIYISSLRTLLKRINDL